MGHKTKILTTNLRAITTDPAPVGERKDIETRKLGSITWEFHLNIFYLKRLMHQHFKCLFSSLCFICFIF